MQLAGRLSAQTVGLQAPLHLTASSVDSIMLREALFGVCLGDLDRKISVWAMLYIDTDCPHGHDACVIFAFHVVTPNI